ncbi:ChaN family lipoprotein [Geobacter sp. OR-1]|uniref:ChaN family lipoprotein n=1 Tax=Geobacter sp. OR-1 TaxID=1266765 RepID=UPI0005AB5002|nr:ChaN family lipoprotein [Geobacter sp. OR-1]
MTSGRVAPEAPFERAADGRRIGFHEMLTDLRTSRVVFIGELHDNPSHHQLQLEIIKWLHRSGAKITVALEMFRAQNQGYLNMWINGDLGVLEFMNQYRNNWTLPWELYDSIFLYARNSGIPLLALNAPDNIMQKVYRQGFKALTQEEKRFLPPDVSCSVDKPYMNFIRRNFVWHSNDEATFIHFCEAQQLRNKFMAYTLSDYLDRNPDRVVVVVTGVGHAMRRGIPDELASIKPMQVKIVMPFLHELAAESLQKGDADYLTRM